MRAVYCHGSPSLPSYSTVIGPAKPAAATIFCYSDLLAVGSMRAVFNVGLSVPEGVAIIDIEEVIAPHQVLVRESTAR